VSGLILQDVQKKYKNAQIASILQKGRAANAIV
jgi:hypothetical protein